jgi:hypothetical protein
MTRRLSIAPRASFDLDDHFAYIAENNFDAAVRFLIQQGKLLLKSHKHLALVGAVRLKIHVWRVCENGQ